MENYWGVQPVRRKSRPMFNTQPVKIRPAFRPLTPLPKQPNKNLSYPQARQRYGLALSPFGNWDRDKHINMFDCRPFDPLRHKVPEEYKDEPVHSFARVSAFRKTFPKFDTMGTVFAEAERQMPDHFKSGGTVEKYYSDRLADALLRRKRVQETPFAKIVGVHTINPAKFDTTAKNELAALIQNYLKDELRQAKPEYLIHFNYPKEPMMVDVEMVLEKPGQPPRYVVTKHKNILKLFNKPPPHIRELTTLFNPNPEKVRILISDYPTDVMRKSTNVPWNSCQTFSTSWNESAGKLQSPGAQQHYVWDDVANKNAIAWIYLDDKIPGKDTPSGRIFLRWGETRAGTPNIGLNPEIYPTSLGGVTHNIVKSYLQSKGYATHNLTTPYQIGSKTFSYTPELKSVTPKDYRLTLSKQQDKIPNRLVQRLIYDKKADSSVLSNLKSRDDLTIPQLMHLCRKTGDRTLCDKIIKRIEDKENKHLQMTPEMYDMIKKENPASLLHLSNLDPERLLEIWPVDHNYHERYIDVLEKVPQGVRAETWKRIQRKLLNRIKNSDEDELLRKIINRRTIPIPFSILKAYWDKYTDPFFLRYYKISESQLKQLLSGQKSETKMAIYQNYIPNKYLSQQMIGKFLKSPIMAERVYVMMYQKIPYTYAERLAKGNIVERICTAISPNLDPRIINVLTNDSDERVRQAIRERDTEEGREHWRNYIKTADFDDLEWLQWRGYGTLRLLSSINYNISIYNENNKKVVTGNPNDYVLPAGKYTIKVGKIDSIDNYLDESEPNSLKQFKIEVPSRKVVTVNLDRQ